MIKLPDLSPLWDHCKRRADSLERLVVVAERLATLAEQEKRP